MHISNPTPQGTDVESDLSKRLPHNYISFVTRDGLVKARFTEINGWLLLEKYLLQEQGLQASADLELAVREWSGAELGGWWPPNWMKSGKRYFSGGTRVNLHDDLDDATWLHALDGKELSDPQLQKFLSNTPLEGSLGVTCEKMNCRTDLILRTWAASDWHDDVDAVTMANAISFLKDNSPLQKAVFQENKRLLNELVRLNFHREFYRYYEPAVTGTALILFYHLHRRAILDPDVFVLLVKEYAEEKVQLKSASLLARWGGGAEEDWFYGFNVYTYNDNLPKLLMTATDLELRKMSKK